MSPKTIMTETLRVLDAASNAQRKIFFMKGDLCRQIIVRIEEARQTIQQLAANSVRAQELVEVMSGRCLERNERSSPHLRDRWRLFKPTETIFEEVRILRRELLTRKVVRRGGREEIDHGAVDIDSLMPEPSREFPSDWSVPDGVEDVPRSAALL